jgi:hypothetical protein
VIPGGVETIEPEPVTVTVSACVPALVAPLNDALADASPDPSVTSQLKANPVHAPVHPPKLAPASGCAVSVMTSPWPKTAQQELVRQVIPAGAELMPPGPVVVTDKVRSAMAVVPQEREAATKIKETMRMARN